MHYLATYQNTHVSLTHGVILSTLQLDSEGGLYISASLCELSEWDMA